LLQGRFLYDAQQEAEQLKHQLTCFSSRLGPVAQAPFAVATRAALKKALAGQWNSALARVFVHLGSLIANGLIMKFGESLKNR